MPGCETGDEPPPAARPALPTVTSPIGHGGCVARDRPGRVDLRARRRGEAAQREPDRAVAPDRAEPDGPTVRPDEQRGHAPGLRGEVEGGVHAGLVGLRVGELAAQREAPAAERDRRDEGRRDGEPGEPRAASRSLRVEPDDDRRRGTGDGAARRRDGVHDGRRTDLRDGTRGGRGGRRVAALPEVRLRRGQQAGLEPCRRLHGLDALEQGRGRLPELGDLGMRLRAGREVRPDRVRLGRLERPEGVQRSEVAHGVAVEVERPQGHGSTPGLASSRRSAPSPRRMRPFTVPSGTPVRSAISVWLRPPK